MSSDGRKTSIKLTTRRRDGHYRGTVEQPLIFTQPTTPMASGSMVNPQTGQFNLKSNINCYR